MSLRTKKETVSGYATYGFASDENTGIHSAAADHIALRAGGVDVLEYGTNASSKVKRLIQCERVALAAVDTAGGVFAWANPTGSTVMITGLAVDVTTVTSGACTIDCGVATDGTTLSDTLIDGASTATTARVIDNIKDTGTNGTSMQRCTSSQYVTGSVASGASAAIVGYAYIYYHII